jgi:drug/metabolite transporter (DMT)-like permease
MMFVYATSNLSGAFTFALAWGAGLEEWTIGKIAGILVCFLGVVLVSLQDSNGDAGNDDGSSSSSSGDHAVSGDILAILAAFGYGLYTTMIRYKVSCS